MPKTENKRDKQEKSQSTETVTQHPNGSFVNPVRKTFPCSSTSYIDEISWEIRWKYK